MAHNQPERAKAYDHFKKALDMIEQEVGVKIILDPVKVSARSKGLMPNLKEPLGFVFPENTEQVQQIVKIANDHSLPLWPVSRGKNWGYGSATPAEDGSLVMVMEKMNRIWEVNEELAYAVIEPGVSYRQLHAYLEEKNLPLWIDCTDGPADGSVIGNALERGIGETPYGDHFANICGIEAVLADGTIMQTGGGPKDRSVSWHTHKWGVGPYLEGLFSQGNYGIVTKIGMWLMPKPERFVSCLFELGSESDFPKMIDAIRRLQHSDALKSKIHIINDAVAFAVAVEDPRELTQGEPYLTEERKRELREYYNISSWLFAGGIYGTRDQVTAHIKAVRKELGPLGRIELLGERKIAWLEAYLRFAKRAKTSPLRNKIAQAIAKSVFHKPIPLLEQLPHMHAIEKGYPSDHFVKHAYFKARSVKPKDGDIDPARDKCGLIWLGPTVPMEGNHVQKFIDLTKPLYQRFSLDYTIALMVAGPRSVIALLSIFFDKQDADESKRALDLYYEIGRITQEAGYQQYRTSTAYMGRILEPAPEFLKVARKIKKSLDPNNIIAPGKYGITID